MGLDIEAIREASAGAIGALVSTTILYPLDTCKTKFQSDNHLHRYEKVSDVLWEAIRKGQILSLYQGLGPKNLLSVIQQFIYFYGYSFFKRLYLKRSNSKSMGTKANLIVAAAAGACTVLVTQPLDTASARMQSSEFGKSKGLWTTLSEGSWSDAYDGLGISLLLTANPSIQYTVFDQLKNKLLTSRPSKNSNSESSPQALSASTVFLLGALSKTIATCLTYPAIRCKAVIQAAKREDGQSTQTVKTRKTISGVFNNIWKHEGMLGYYKGLEAQILKTVLSSALLLMIKEKIAKISWVLMLALRKSLLVTATNLKSA
ncbi:hypothetical protein vseg_012141 [Gypsophila vaccaria]